MDKSRILIFALILYCVSLALPGVSFTDQTGTHSMYGIAILAVGWLAMTKWVFAWFANPLLLFALFRSRVERPGVILLVSIIAFGFGLSALTMREIPNFSGVATPDAHLAIGYYVWMISLGLFVCYGFLRYRQQEVNPAPLQQATHFDFFAVLIKNARLLIGLVILLAMLFFVLMWM